MLFHFSLTLVPESDKIAVMKNFFRLFLILLFIISIAACASTENLTGAEQNKSQGNEASIKEKKQKHKKLLFEDWKYKGFGQPLPGWFEAACKGDVEELRKQIKELSAYEIKVLSAEGINSDQAEKSLRLKIDEFSTEYSVYASSWAMIADNEYPYFAAAVLYK